MGVWIRKPTAESSENVNEEKCQRCLKYNRMTGWGLIRVKEQEESASELVPLAEAGKTTDGGQDGG